MKREQDNLGNHISNSDPNSNENLRSPEDVDFETEIATYVSLAQAQSQAQDPIIEPMEIADLIPPIKDELPTSPRQESGFGDLKLPEVIQGERAKRLYKHFDEELANALMESNKGFQNTHQKSRIADKSYVEKKGKGRAEIPSIDLSLIESQSTYGSQSSLYQNLLEQEKYDPSIHGSSSRDSHIASSELKLSADEQQLIDNGILSCDEILQQRIQMSQYQDQRSFQSQSQSQGLFLQRTNYFARNSGESVKGESMAKSGPARGIDHEFIERQRGLGFSSEGFPGDLGSSESLEKELLSGYELIEQIEKKIGKEIKSRRFEISRKIDESFDYLEDGPTSLLGSEEDDHELLDLNEAEIELLESGVSIEDILELREQIAQEQIQPLSAQSLDSNSSQKSPSRE